MKCVCARLYCILINSICYAVIGITAIYVGVVISGLFTANYYLSFSTCTFFLVFFNDSLQPLLHYYLYMVFKNVNTRDQKNKEKIKKRENYIFILDTTASSP